MILREISEFIKRTCVFFTVGTLAFLIAGTAFSGDVATGEDGFAYIYTKLILFGALLCFSAFVSLAVSVSSAVSFDIIFKVLINFAICYVGFYVSFFVLLGNFSLLGQFAYMSFIFFVAYAVICAVYLIIRGIRSKFENENSSYTELYSELDENKQGNKK